MGSGLHVDRQKEMISIKARNYKTLSTDMIVKEIYKLLDYSLDYEDRVKTIEYIDEEFGEALQHHYFTYKTSNLKRYENRTAYDRICNVYDKMSEYILFSNHDLDDTEIDKDGLTAAERKSSYTFSQESNLKTMQSKSDISLDTYMYTMSNSDGTTKIQYDDQNHATYTLKDFEDKVDECPYIRTYMEFNKNARRIIKILDKQANKLIAKGVPFKQIKGLKYKNPSGKVFYYDAEHLSAIKRGIGYTKNNSKEIDQDMITIYREWFKPIYFQSVTRAQEFTRKMDLDFMDREHMAGLIKTSCLTGQFGKFDEYVYRLDKLVKQANLTELELQVYNVLRKGKGLDLDKNKYEDNMTTISECARILERSQSKVDEAFNSLVDKVMDKYEETYEDYYFTYIARGTYKTCSKCNDVKLANERYFRKRSDGKGDGYRNECRKCEIALKIR